MYSLSAYTSRTWTSRRSQARGGRSESLLIQFRCPGRPLGGAERRLWSLVGGLELWRPGEREDPLDCGLEGGQEGDREGGREE